MEIALDQAMPTYSGGLGVLAGDSMAASADLGLPLVGVTLLHHKGYFRQHLSANGRQSETPAEWRPEEFLQRTPERARVSIEGRTVQIAIWRHDVQGSNGTVPVFLLDTALPENDPFDQTLTDELYGGDARYRLCQETLLGIGGVAALRALGYGSHLSVYHMNEGHSGLLTLALLEERLAGRSLDSASDADLAAVRERCVFTVHTPVPAGHDRFPLELVKQVLGAPRASLLARLASPDKAVFNLSLLAVEMSHRTNAVSMRHGQVSRVMFMQKQVAAITNGVHAKTWTSAPVAALFDTHVPGWRTDNCYLRYAVGIPLGALLRAHEEAKSAMISEIEERAGVALDPATFTIAFARRATPYKRAEMLFHDIERLRRIVRRVGPLQVIYAGKAHPNDSEGKALIEHIFKAAHDLQDQIRVVYLEEYGIPLAKHLVAGVDLWLNNPQKPLEASGTSGMKAALNGVPSLSVIDGWWVEGWIEGVTGWAIGDATDQAGDLSEEAGTMYDKLEYVILPMYYQRREAFAEVMRSAIAINGSFFNAQRMMDQYARVMYELPSPPGVRALAPV
jgi:starch phosphorylase